MSGFAAQAPPEVPSGADGNGGSAWEPAPRTGISRGVWLLGVTFVGGLVIAAALVVLSTSGSSSDNLPQASPAQIQQLLAGIPQHGNTLGNPSAPVKITEFADLQCPYCMAYARGVFPTMVEKYVRTGRAVMVINLTTAIGHDSVTAAQAAVAAGEQNKLWNFVDNFYNHQGTENSGYVTDKFLTNVGSLVPGLDVAQMMANRSQPGVQSTLATYHQQYKLTGMKGTPTFVLQRSGHPPVKLLGAGHIKTEVAALAK